MAVTYTTLTVGRASTAATFTVRGYSGAIVGYAPPATVTTFLTTELGDFLVTEAGDFLTT